METYLFHFITKPHQGLKTEDTFIICCTHSETVHLSVVVPELLRTLPHSIPPAHSAPDSQESRVGCRMPAWERHGHSWAPGHWPPCRVHATARDKPVFTPQLGRGDGAPDSLPDRPHSLPLPGQGTLKSHRLRSPALLAAQEGYSCVDRRLLWP